MFRYRVAGWLVAGLAVVTLAAGCGATATASPSAPTPSTAPTLTELVASEWSAFCTSPRESLYNLNPDTWANLSERIEAALAPGGSPTTEDGADLLALLRTVSEARDALSEAIGVATASQAVVGQCPPSSCAVFVRETTVRAMDSSGLGGPAIRLDVDEELSAYWEAIADLATGAQELGLEDCSMLAGDE